MTICLASEPAAARTAHIKQQPPDSNYIAGETLLEVIMVQPPTHSSKILLEWIRTEFNLPESMARECTQYYLRVWDGSIVDTIHDGILSINGKEWIVHWQSTPAVCREAKKIAVSFREFTGKRYVVVKVWKGGGGE